MVRIVRGAGTVKDMTDVAQGSPFRRDEQGVPAAELEGLLRRSALGDTTAFGTLYDHTAPRFYQLAFAVTGDPRRAEEATRAAYAQIWARSREFDAATHRALSWMTTIVYELARSLRLAQTA